MRCGPLWPGLRKESTSVEHFCVLCNFGWPDPWNILESECFPELKRWIVRLGRDAEDPWHCWAQSLDLKGTDSTNSETERRNIKHKKSQRNTKKQESQRVKERKVDYLALKTNNTPILAYLENSCKFSCTSVRWLSSVVTPGTKGQLSLLALSRCFMTVATYLDLKILDSSNSQFSIPKRAQRASPNEVFEWVSTASSFISCLQNAGKRFNWEKRCHAMQLNYIQLLTYILIYIYIQTILLSYDKSYTFPTYLHLHVYYNVELVLAVRESEVKNQSCRTGTGAAANCQSFCGDFIHFCAKMWQDMTSHTSLVTS